MEAELESALRSLQEAQRQAQSSGNVRAVAWLHQALSAVRWTRLHLRAGERSAPHQLSLSLPREESGSQPEEREDERSL